MAKLLHVIICSLAFCHAEMGRQRRWRMERRKKAAAAAAAARREREKQAPRDAESTSDGTIANWKLQNCVTTPPRPSSRDRSVSDGVAAVPLNAADAASTPSAQIIDF